MTFSVHHLHGTRKGNMKFKELQEMIPYAKGGKEKSLSMEPYPNIRLMLPGRHAEQTVPKGGDFCVCVTDPEFKRKEHQFTHSDLFKDAEKKSSPSGLNLAKDYLSVIQGADPVKIDCSAYDSLPGLDAQTFLFAAQCLAVAEHRRYHQFENKFGGRFLPARFYFGIAEGLWTAADAASMEKKGRPGVEIVERLHGVPELTKELMS